MRYFDHCLLSEVSNVVKDKNEKRMKRKGKPERHESFHARRFPELFIYIYVHKHKLFTRHIILKIVIKKKLVTITLKL